MKLRDALDKQLTPMLDFEYEQKREGDLSDDEGEQVKDPDGKKPMDVPTVSLTFDVGNCSVAELEDMMFSGEFLKKLSARTIVRPRLYDRLLQSAARLKQAKAKSTTAGQRYKREQRRKARHSTRGAVLAELQQAHEAKNPRKHLLSTLIPGQEPVLS